MDVSLFFNLLFDLIFIALPMDWNQLLSAHRYHPGSTTSLFHSHDRSQFQRDYDRLIFSSPFRRLQNKTQVFPLPGNIFVHNRLTHSLEVASVGRSLGNKVSQFLKQQQVEIENPEILEEIGTIVSTGPTTWGTLLSATRAKKRFPIFSVKVKACISKNCFPTKNGMT